MQVTETLSEGLKRELKIVIPAAELEERLQNRLNDLKDRVQIRGFRPGKVPMAHLRKVYGKPAMAEIIQETVIDASRKALEERGEKAAMQPELALPASEDEAEEVVTGNADLAFTMVYEVLPPIELGDFTTIALERPVAEVADAEVEARIEEIRTGHIHYHDKGEAAAEMGDKLMVGFIGKIDGEPFEGGTGSGVEVVIGSGQFIPGFEAQLLGAKVGEQRTVEVTFPEDYGTKRLAGKPATFDVTIEGVAAPEEQQLDDHFASHLGVESLEKLREIVREQIGMEYTARSRQKVKRSLLDALDEMHKFELPPKMVEEEFSNVWREVEADLARTGNSFEDEGTDEAKAREEYRGIAERRVRLGLVLAEVGEKNEIKVNDDEVQRALVERMRQFPGQERQVYDFYRNNPEALASLRAPIFEEKVVDHILGSVTMTDTPVSKDDLFADPDDE
ncbi:MAG: trigger factor [Hyphomicrobiales bacterium]